MALPSIQTEFWDYVPGFLGQEADAFLEALTKAIDWEERQITLFGKKVLQPRLMAYYGDPGTSYKYSGLMNHPSPWTETLLRIRESLKIALGQDFNCVLCNLYRNGQDSMGWHSDDEPELGTQPAIASLSLGQVRKFQIREKNKGSQIQNLPLEHGSLLYMKRGFQERYKHALPKDKSTKPRLNLTFRRIG